MSILPPKADICDALWHVRLVPKADIRVAINDTFRAMNCFFNAHRKRLNHARKIIRALLQGHDDGDVVSRRPAFLVENGVLMLTVAKAILKDGSEGILEHPVRFCPFCGKPVQGRSEKAGAWGHR